MTHPATPKAARPFEGPLFIVGMPRSGTKLLRGILNRHARVAVPRTETEFLPYWVERWSAFGDLADARAFRRFHARCFSLPFFVYLEEAGQVIDPDRWHEACRAYTPEAVFEALIRTHLGLTPGDGVIWGDKSPSCLTHLPLLKRLYPDARFIHIVRDVRDYCLSIRNAWGKNMLRAAQRWNDDVAAARAAGEALGRDYLELRYEDLLTAPGETVGRACDLLGVEYSDELLLLDSATEKIGAARGTAGIMKTNLGKYESGMTPRERSRIEAIAGATLSAAGYECARAGRPRRISAPHARWLQLQDGLNLLAFSARERGLLGALRFLLRYFAISGNRRRGT